jgi:hypothetical protein
MNRSPNHLSVRRGEHADDAAWRSSLPCLQPRCPAMVPRTGRSRYRALPSEWLIIFVMLTDRVNHPLPPLLPFRVGRSPTVIANARSCQWIALHRVSDRAAKMSLGWMPVTPYGSRTPRGEPQRLLPRPVGPPSGVSLRVRSLRWGRRPPPSSCPPSRPKQTNGTSCSTAVSSTHERRPGSHRTRRGICRKCRSYGRSSLAFGLRSRL